MSSSRSLLWGVLIQSGAEDCISSRCTIQYPGVGLVQEPSVAPAFSEEDLLLYEGFLLNQRRRRDEEVERVSLDGAKMSPRVHEWP